MKFIEAVILDDLDGGQKPFLSKDLSITIDFWGSGYQPRLIDSSVYAFLRWDKDLDLVRRACRELRKSSFADRMQITAFLKQHDSSIISAALDAGADTYVIGTLNRDYVVNSLTRSFALNSDHKPRTISYRDISIELDNAKARYNGDPIPLWPNELNLLTHFVSNPGVVFSRRDLISALGKDGSGINDKTIFRVVSRLRTALQKLGGKDAIRTVRSSGYIMD
jgi:two-component system phosphate regulon response regulator PhoB